MAKLNIVRCRLKQCALRKADASYAIKCLQNNHLKAYFLGRTNKGNTMKIAERIRQFAENRRAIRELSRLDDHVLSDLGLSRSHIRSAVLGKAR